jgi:hypothetical protein
MTIGIERAPKQYGPFFESLRRRLLSERRFSDGPITIIAIPVAQRTEREIASQGVRHKTRVTTGGEFSHVHAVPGGVKFQAR